MKEVLSTWFYPTFERFNGLRYAQQAAYLIEPFNIDSYLHPISHIFAQNKKQAIPRRRVINLIYHIRSLRILLISAM